VSENRPERLLAKSTQTPEHPAPAQTLQGHTALVVAAAEELLASRAEASLRAAGLGTVDVERLARIVRLAAFVHDLGKCSDHFQAMLRGQRDTPQLMRHEALSLWLCWPGQLLSGWLRPAVDADVDYLIAVVAAAAHHRKFWARAVAPAAAGAGTSLTLLVAHDDFRSLLRAGMRKLALSDPPTSASDLTIECTRRSRPERRFEAWEDDWRGVASGPASDILPICKAFVLAADVAGSALPTAGESSSWIREQLAQRATADQLRSVVSVRLGGKPLRPFQQSIAASNAPITLARAGCGSGKTAAAYQWAADQHPGRQLWVTYPTTGTATEGFRDYIIGTDPSDRPDVLGRLDHSRAAVDLEMFGLTDGADGARERDRLDALRAWGCDVVTCTVDTVLGLVQNQRKGLYAWPGLAHAAVVFDEVHAYDDQLFGALLRFLEALPGIPALLMTASLPEQRLLALRAVADRVHSKPLGEIAGPTDLETLPRYRVRAVPDAWQDVEACIAAGGKVLWVSNTVNRCVGLADREGLPTPARVYHSRFKYIDRVRRHGEVIEAFRGPGAALALTTQVAEMSLDLSADLLVTDLAPIPAMIQRLGRLNRRSTPAEPIPPKPFVVLPFRGLPYEPTDLDATSDWLNRLGGGDLTQRSLVDAWTQANTVPESRTASAWLDGGFSTEAAALREGSPGITIVLPEDAGAVRSGARSAVEVAVPMNPPPGPADAWRDWPTARFYPVPPPDLITYDQLRGAQWRRA
jgi:CRISPR-associated endonuclease/helicase Cas3